MNDYRSQNPASPTNTLLGCGPSEKDATEFLGVLYSAQEGEKETILGMTNANGNECSDMQNTS